VQEGGYLSDLLSSQADPEDQAMQMRRIIYEQLDYLDQVYAYYRDDMSDNWSAENPVATRKHDGHEPQGDETMLRLSGVYLCAYILCMYVYIYKCACVYT
jgi:hypothetical protein